MVGKCFILQEALSALAAWADEWQLSVSIDKCGVLYVGKGMCSAPKQFKLHDPPLPIVSSYRDLGITITRAARLLYPKYGRLFLTK